VLAEANFRLGQYLYQHGNRQAAQQYFSEAERLHPENWRIKRQSLESEEPGKAFGSEFWAAVDELGEKPYYPLVKL
jgi:Tetratricopeptide repeat